MSLPTAQLQYFRSPVDGRLHPCAVCATDTGPEPKPLLIEVSPGAMTDLPGAVALTEEMAAIAAAAGRSCVVLRPTGRGPGSVYQNYGEVDVLEAIEHVAAHHAIDRARISITGSSMGGAAVWYLVSHYPDLFAAAAPFCGYCDYRLWEKPGAWSSACTPGRSPPGSPARPPFWWTTCGTRRCGSSTGSGTGPWGAACPWRTRAAWRSCWRRGGSPTPTPKCPAPATAAARRRSGNR